MITAASIFIQAFLLSLWLAFKATVLFFRGLIIVGLVIAVVLEMLLGLILVIISGLSQL